MPVYRPVPANPRRLLPLLLVALLHGCTVLGPEFRTPESEAPSAWSDWHGGAEAPGAEHIDTAAQPAAQWWREFDDPVLDRLQQRLLDNSPDLHSAMLNFTRARLQQQLTASARGVEISADGSLTRQRLSEHGAQMRMAAISAPGNSDALISALAEPYSLYQAGFDAGWEPDLWGRISRSIEAAEADSRAGAALLAQARLGLGAELARRYFELRALQRKSALLDDEISLAEAQLQLLDANREAGLGSELELEAQRSRLAEQRAALPTLQSRTGAAENAIALLLGERPGALRDLLTAAGESAQLPQMGDLSLGLPSELARRRPDIRAAEARLHAATAEIGVAMADLYPRVTLSAGFGLESFEEGAFGNWASRQWSIGPRFYLPIFNQGRLKTRVELTELAQQQAAVNYHQTVLGAWREVDDALTAYGAEYRRYRRLQQKLDAAERQAALIAAHRSAGLVDAGAQLSAESAALAIERQLAESAATLNIQRVAVYKAVGGGVESRDKQD